MRLNLPTNYPHPLSTPFSANLTWRDVQYLLVYTSNPHYPHEEHWITNGAGLRVSHLFGFGVIDATALVNRARNWISVPPRVNCSVSPPLGDSLVSIPSQPLNIKTSFTADCVVSYIEHTQAFVTLKMLAGQRKDVSISLTSPKGTTSILLPHRRSDRHADGIHNWPFMTVLTWGEEPTGGEWLLSVSTENGAKAQLSEFTLMVHGTHGTPRALRDVPADCHSECKGRCSAPGPEYCDDCKNYRLSSTLACVGACPTGTFQNHHMCRECPHLCEECTDQHTCVKCADGAVRLEDGLCAEGCPSLTYLAPDHTCQACHHSCLSCKGSTEGNCTDCPGQLSLQDGKCVLRSPESCSTRQYFDHRALECRTCHVSCQNCTGKESDQCTSCYGDNILTDDGRCEEPPPPVPDCEHRQFFDRESSSCSQCPENCTVCSTNVTCTHCDSAYFLTPSGECVEHCPNRTVTDNTTLTCLDTSCSDNCLTCFGAEADSCTSCVEGALLLGSSCVTECPAHTFPLDNTTCQHCSNSCATCDGPSDNHCLSCPEGKLVHQSHCLSVCPSGSFASNDSCLPCPANCTQCSSGTSCTVCAEGYIVTSDHTCVEKCPEGFIAHPTTKTCLPCPAHCLECFNTKSCHKCEDNFVYYAPNRSCQPHCPDGYYPSPDKSKCLECTHPCSTCKGGSNNCLSCQVNMVLDSDTRKCMPCCNQDNPRRVPCCDCDASTTECVKKSSLGTQEPLVERSGNRYGFLVVSSVAILVVVILTVGLVIFLLVRRRRRDHAGVVRRYKTLGREPLEIVDNSGSEVEVFASRKKKGYTTLNTIERDPADSGSEVEVFTSRKKGYATVDTIDHDNIDNDIS